MDVSDLRCVFSVNKSINETPNYSHIIIYNLASNTIAKIKNGWIVILSAGYKDGNYGMIFTGEVVQHYVTREEGVNTLLHLICQDGDAFLNGSFTVKTLEKGSSAMDVVSACADLPTNQIGQQVKGKPAYIRGKVMFGMSAKYLRGVAKTTETQFYVEDRKINIVGAKDYGPNEAVLLTPETGLIGDPTQTDNGVSGQCLINPSIKLNTLIKIDSSYIVTKALDNAESAKLSFASDGVYRITKLTYEGDTHGDPWYCTFEAIDRASDAATGSGDGTGSQGTQAGSPTATTPEGTQESVLYQLVNGNLWR